MQRRSCPLSLLITASLMTAACLGPPDVNADAPADAAGPEPEAAAGGAGPFDPDVTVFGVDAGSDPPPATSEPGAAACDAGAVAPPSSADAGPASTPEPEPEPEPDAGDDPDATAAPTLAGLVWISELLPNEPGADGTALQSFVELSGVPETLLDGARLELLNGADGKVYERHALTGTIDASGFFVLGEPDVAALDQSAKLNLQNGPDSVRLVDATGAVVDAVGYGVFEPDQVFAGETSPAPLPPEGQTLSRRFTDATPVDGDDNAQDFCVGDATPGAPPICSAPDPQMDAGITPPEETPDTGPP